MKTIARILFTTALLGWFATDVASAAGAQDWPTWRGGACRDGYTTNTAPSAMELVWKRIPRHRPSPAFPSQVRQQYDMTYHPVVAGGVLYFGSSADGKIYAIDAATGRTTWTFFTDAPVRTPPAVWEDGVYVGSDDGNLYCLDRKTGKLRWKCGPFPRDERIMGNDRMICRWPVRSGPTVSDGVVYFVAGMWPTEGVYVRALDAHTGKVLWANDDCGNIQHKTPRAGNPRSGLAAQGPIAVGNGVVVVPTGRACPAVFDAKTGKLKYFRHGDYFNKTGGGTNVAVLGSLIAYGENYPNDVETTTRVAEAGSGEGVNVRRMTSAYAETPKMLVMADGATLSGYDKAITSHERKNRDGSMTTYKMTFEKRLWSCDVGFDILDVVVAGDKAVVGGKGKIAILDIPSAKLVAKADVGEDVLSLAVAEGCVYAAGPSGTLYCFGANGAGKVVNCNPPDKSTSRGGMYADAARKIVAATGLTEGYCLDIGCGDGELAYELALQTKLNIYGVTTNPAKIERARALLDGAGLWGTRVTIHLVASLDHLPYAGKFAELLVSSKALTEGGGAANRATVDKMLCPQLGVACLGKPDQLKVTRAKPIAGSANWTHFYADAGNSNCGTDTAVRAPLGLLWFRDTDYPMADRHSMSSPTMVYNGYMVMPGTFGVRVANMYNGRPIWQHDFPGLNLYPGGFSYERRLLTGNMCVAEGKVYVRFKDSCTCFDIRDGRPLGQWKLPRTSAGGSEPLWAYIACKDGILYGSVADNDVSVKGYPGPDRVKDDRKVRDAVTAWPRLSPNHQHPDSKVVFAMGATTGKLLWQHAARNAIHSSAIAVGNGMVYFVDRPTSPFDDYASFQAPRGTLEQNRINKMAQRLATEMHTTFDTAMAELKNPHGPLVALDSRTGKVVWQTDAKTGSGDILEVSPDGKVVVMVGTETIAFNAADGNVLWKARPLERPMLVGRQLRAGCQILDIATGERTGTYPRLGGYCAPTQGSPMLLACRSGVVAYRDITDAAREVEFFGGIRPGCYYDMTLAGGLLVMADGAAGCKCSYMNQCTIALEPRQAPQPGR